MIFSRAFEMMPREDMDQLQIERLQATLNRVYRNVALYKQTFDEQNIDISRIKSVADLKELPLTTKEDLRTAYPYDMFAVPLRDVVRIHATSGTTGKPIVVGYTRNDVNTWSSMVARVLTAAGITNRDFVQIAFNYNLTTGGFGFHYGAEKLGASVIPASSQDIDKQIAIMKDFKTTALIGTPGYALHIASILAETHTHPEQLFLSTGLFGSEPWSENLRAQIEEQLHIKAFDNYGSSEIMGPGVAFECEERNGLHINEDHLIVEVIDPKTEEALAPGQEGELVFTTITKQGFPLIRYRTGDISSLQEGPCACGRTLARMQRVFGRSDDMIIVEGINVFPAQIEEVLLQLEGIEPHYQIILDREAGEDVMDVHVEVADTLPFVDDLSRLVQFKNTVAEHINRVLGIACRVTLVEPKSLSRSSGEKMKRVVDKRDM
jgi:phenylacetate-CoA ligase